MACIQGDSFSINNHFVRKYSIFVLSFFNFFLFSKISKAMAHWLKENGEGRKRKMKNYVSFLNQPIANTHLQVFIVETNSIAVGVK